MIWLFRAEHRFEEGGMMDWVGLSKYAQVYELRLYTMSPNITYLLV